MAELAHIPHIPALPFLGHTLAFLRDPYALNRASAEAHGPVYKVKLLGKWRVTLNGAEAVDYLLRDPDKLFSSEQGNDVLHPIFTGGLAARDFSDHRKHRRIMQTAFRREAMLGYTRQLYDVTETMVDAMPVSERFRFADVIKELLLQASGQVLMGLDVDSADLVALNRDFSAEVAGCVGVVRRPLPGTAMGRGMRAKASFKRRLERLIPERRAGKGEDFFSQMCRAEDEDGAVWTDQEIFEHFNFLLLAAHDTTASALTTIAWGIAAGAPEWQERLRELALTHRPAMAAARAADDDVALSEIVGQLVPISWAHEEALRYRPPVPFVSRRALRDFTWKGHAIPAGTFLTVPMAPLMMDPDAFPDPDRFDPGRFAPDRAEHTARRPSSWVPWGGGAHKCIGMHFAYAHVRIAVASLLERFEIEVLEPDPDWTLVPITRPRDGLPVILHPRT